MLYVVVPVLLAAFGWPTFAIRVSDEVVSDIEEEVHRPVLDAAELAYVRGAIEEIGIRHAQTIKDYNLTVESDVSISDALENRWAAEEADKQLWNGYSSNELRKAKVVVKNMGLSVTYARREYKKDRYQPTALTMKKCYNDVFMQGKTRIRGFFRFMWIKGYAETALYKSEQFLNEQGRNLGQTLELFLKDELDWKFLYRVSSREFLARPDVLAALEVVKKNYWEHYHQLWDIWGFSLDSTRAYCKRIHKEETVRHQEKLVDRLIAELQSPAHWVDGQCVEKSGEGLSCAEGTKPQYNREWRGRQGRRVFGTVFSFYGEVSSWFPIVSLVFSFPWGYLWGLAAYVFPLPGLILSALIGTGASVPWTSDCRCTPVECHYYEEGDRCGLKASDTSSNRYNWLPYMGTKCAPVLKEDGKSVMKENGQTTCVLQPCVADDFVPDLKDGHIFGKIGAVRDQHTAGTYNCLSSDGTGNGNLLVADQIPNLPLPGNTFANTIPNRLQVYDVLGPVQQ